MPRGPSAHAHAHVHRLAHHHAHLEQLVELGLDQGPRPAVVVCQREVRRTVAARQLGPEIRDFRPEVPKEEVADALGCGGRHQNQKREESRRQRLTAACGKATVRTNREGHRGLAGGVL